MLSLLLNIFSSNIAKISFQIYSMGFKWQGNPFPIQLPSLCREFPLLGMYSTRMFMLHTCKGSKHCCGAVWPTKRFRRRQPRRSHQKLPLPLCTNSTNTWSVFGQIQDLNLQLQYSILHQLSVRNWRLSCQARKTNSKSLCAVTKNFWMPESLSDLVL